MKLAKVFAGVLFSVLIVFSLGTRVARDDAGLEALFSASMRNIDGEAMTLAEFRGKPVVVNFWSRFCAPCREEIPELVEFQEKYKKQGLIVIGVALEDDPGKARDFLLAYKVNYPVALVGDAGLSLMKTLGNDVMGLPFTLFINKDGEVVWVKRGVLKKNDLEENVRKVF